MKITTTDEYLNNLDENGRKAVENFIHFMRAEFPEIGPVICYGMPMWKLGMKLYDGYVAVSAAKGHFSVHFHDEILVSGLSKQLSGCSFGKRCVNIRYRDECSIARVMQSVKEYVNKTVGPLSE